MQRTDLYPLLSEPVDTGCAYLRQNAIHRELHEGLKRSILVIALGENQNGGGTVKEVQYYLYQTHGGHNHLHYPSLKYSKDIYLIQLPPHLDQDEVITAGNAWGVTQEWSFRYFNIDEDAGEQPKWFRARLHIRNFPLDFWHKDYIQYACAGFGEVRYIEDQYITGNDRSMLALDLICIDPRRIPPTATLPFGRKWKQMYIHIASWEYNHWVPEEAMLTVEEHRQITRGLNNIADLAKGTLNAAHNKLQTYLITPDPPTPPASPSYFSDDALEMPNIIELPQHTIQNHSVMTTKDPQTHYANSPSHLMQSKNPEQATSLLGRQPTLMPLNDKACTTLRVGDICIGQGFTNQSCQFGIKDQFQQRAINGDFRKFSMEMICVGQIKVLQAVLTYPNQKDATDKPLVGLTHATATSQTEQEKCIGNYITEGNKAQKPAGPLYKHPNSHKGPPCKPEILPHSLKFATGPNYTINTNNYPTNSLYETTASTKPINPPPIADTPPKNKNSQEYQHQPTPEHAKTNSDLNKRDTMATSDEDFIAKFAALSASPTVAPVKISSTATIKREWPKCVIVRIVTDRVVPQHQFTSMMTKAWDIKAQTGFTPINRNLYVVQFENIAELERTMNRGPWNFKGEMVILKRAQGPADMVNAKVNKAEVWTQWHQAPPDSVSKEGVMGLAERLGTPLSEVRELFNGGSQYFRIKLLLDIDAPLQDHMDVDHPIMGTFPILLTYERITRICLFCGMVGHQHADCPDKIRMMHLKTDPRFRDREDMHELTKLKLNPWINDASALPNPTPLALYDTTALPEGSRTSTVRRPKRRELSSDTPVSEPTSEGDGQLMVIEEIQPEHAAKKRVLEARQGSPSAHG